MRRLKLYQYLLVIFVLFSATYILIWKAGSSGRRRNLRDNNDVISDMDLQSGFDDLMNKSRRAMNESSPFDNALVAGTLRSAKGFLTIGIPTVKRPKGALYIQETLDDLIRNTDDEEKQNIILLVFLADTDPAAKTELRNLLLRKFGDYIRSGLIQIIQAPSGFYPSFDHLEATYKQYFLKTKWLSKQNFDYAFMMMYMYSEGLSEFYMQLEDDVTTVPGYISIIKDFMSEQKQRWTCLEFSALGFIAKLYHSYDLEKLAKLLMLFYHEQPNDVTYLYFNQINRQEHRIVRKPTIFKHLGLHSSLPGKKQTRNDPLFKAVKGEVNKTIMDGVVGKTILNPPAKIVASLKFVSGTTAEKCYANQGSLWSYGPRKNARLTMVFDQPQHLSNVTIISGSDDHPDDFVQYGILQIGQGTGRLTNGHTVCTDIMAAQVFDHGRVSLSLDESAMNLDAACVQIWFTKSHNTWLMITQIAIEALQR